MKELSLHPLSHLGPHVAARDPVTTRHRARWRRERWFAAVMLVLWVFPGFAHALDEIVLKNGRRYLGTIVTTTADTIVLQIEGGTVGFPRTMIALPAYLSLASGDGTSAARARGTVTAEEIAPHPLPGVPEALRQLSLFPWAGEIRQMPVLVTDQGRWQFTPCASFWAASFFQINIYGDPARPAAIVLGLPHPGPTAWDEKQKLLEYILSLAPALAIDRRFDALDVNGDQFSIGDVSLEVTGPDSAKSPERWVVSLIHEVSLQSARASYEELQGISELVTTAMIDPQQPRSWQQGSWTPDELAWARQAPGAPQVESLDAGGPAAESNRFTGLGGHRIYVRAYAREDDHYVRVSTDWTHSFSMRGK